MCALVEETRAPASPLERRMDDLGRKGTMVSVVAGGVAAAAGVARGVPAGQVLRAGVALGVAAIPEGLPVVVTASLVAKASIPSPIRRGSRSPPPC